MHNTLVNVLPPRHGIPPRRISQFIPSSRTPQNPTSPHTPPRIPFLRPTTNATRNHISRRRSLLLLASRCDRTYVPSLSKPPSRDDSRRPSLNVGCLFFSPPTPVVPPRKFLRFSFRSPLGGIGGCPLGHSGRDGRLSSRRHGIGAEAVGRGGGVGTTVGVDGDMGKYYSLLVGSVVAGGCRPDGGRETSYSRDARAVFWQEKSVQL
ncbi:hypothetical protein ACHAWX_005181 [Stephanocyclus meneghinianus]